MLQHYIIVHFPQSGLGAGDICSHHVLLFASTYSLKKT